MKTILNKIEFHYTFLIMALGLVLTGHFSNLIVFTSLVIIHELGHVLASTLFKYKVSKIIIYPYGGLTKLDTLVNTNITKDLLVALCGIIMQSIYYYLVFFLYKNNIIREYIFNLFNLYHYSMLIFNIFPIIPLDGSKIVNLILSKYLNFNLSNKLTIVISFISIIILLKSNLYENNYSLLMVVGIFLTNIYNFYKDLELIYNKFLLERYLYDIYYKKVKIIKDKNKMYKNKMHYFNINNKLIKEREYLTNFFLKKH